MAELTNEVFQIKFDTERLIKFIAHISNVSNVATAICQTTKGCTIEQLNPLETDGLALVFSDYHGRTRVTDQHISDWVLGKAFEDFIIGLLQSLGEISIFLKTVTVAESTKVNPYANEEAMHKALAEFSADAQKMNFKQLIECIEKLLGTTLLFKEEIYSINQVRNRFVHNKDTTDLTLKYIRHKLHAQVNGELFEVTKKFKSKRTKVENISIEYLSGEMVIKAGERIVITPDVFKDVTFTCIWFLQAIIKQLPLPDNIKELLAPPATINIAFGYNQP